MAAILLLSGYYAAKKGNTKRHKRFMIAAFICSALFLVFYLTYHFTHPPTPFPGDGLARYFYFTLLITHVVAAMALVPMAITTLYRGLKEQFERHPGLARWTFGVWLYVSVTGVIIYLMLYHIYR